MLSPVSSGNVLQRGKNMIVSGSSRCSGRLRVIFRSHGGENLKARPAFYSKLLALTSFVRAVEQLEITPEVIFLNDGPIPADRVDLMRRFGEVVQVNCGSNRRSYRAALGLAARRPWHDDDLVWFAEDDYLYPPDSLQILSAGVQAIASGDYFSLYSPVDVAAGRSRPAPGKPSWPPSGGSPPVLVNETRWFRAMSTTSTFGVRMRALNQDLHLLRMCPFTGGAWDHTTCLMVQGHRPFGWDELRTDLAPFRTGSSWARSIPRGLIRIGMNERSRRRQSRCRTLHAADPLPIWHLETSSEQLPQDVAHWADLAEQTRKWGLQQ